jgi:hypothetical protein
MAKVLVTMSANEIDRGDLVLEKRLKQAQAAELMGLGVRQIKRMCRAFKIDGLAGLTSRKRGRPSNRRLTPALQARAVALVRERLPRLRSEAGAREAPQAARRPRWARDPKKMAHRGWGLADRARANRRMRPRRVRGGRRPRMPEGDRAHRLTPASGKAAGCSRCGTRLRECGSLQIASPAPQGRRHRSSWRVRGRKPEARCGPPTRPYSLSKADGRWNAAISASELFEKKAVAERPGSATAPVTWLAAAALDAALHEEVARRGPAVILADFERAEGGVLARTSGNQRQCPQVEFQQLLGPLIVFHSCSLSPGRRAPRPHSDHQRDGRPSLFRVRRHTKS